MIMAELKTKLNDASVEKFLASVDEHRRSDCAVVVALMQKITKSPPKMWGASIIGFGQYDWPLVAFSPRKQNLTLYIMAGFAEYEGLMAALGKHTTGKSCLYIKQLSDIDMKVLEKLVKASVKFMKAKYPT
jgi:Domain of unknown function (DU1801)